MPRDCDQVDVQHHHLEHYLVRLVYWLDHSPTASGLLEFIIPLVLLPLLASSYAEVNYEGAKIIQVRGAASQ